MAKTEFITDSQIKAHAELNSYAERISRGDLGSVAYAMKLAKKNKLPREDVEKLEKALHKGVKTVYADMLLDIEAGYLPLVDDAISFLRLYGMNPAILNSSIKKGEQRYPKPADKWEVTQSLLMSREIEEAKNQIIQHYEEKRKKRLETAVEVAETLIPDSSLPTDRLLQKCLEEEKKKARHLSF